MREICMSGSTRGQQVTIGSPAVLLYCSSAAHHNSAAYHNKVPFFAKNGQIIIGRR